MRKLVLFFVTIVTMFFSVSCSSPSKRNEEKLKTIISKEDDAAIVKAYADGPRYSALRQPAVDAALRMTSKNHWVDQRGWDKNVYITLERSWSADSVARLFYKQNNRDVDINARQTIDDWNVRMDKLLSSLSDSVQLAIKRIVIMGAAPHNEVDALWTRIESNKPVVQDLVWAQRYLPKEEILQICLKNISYRTMFFLQRTTDSVLMNMVTSKLPDSLIVQYEIGSRIEPERQFKIAKSMPLVRALQFLDDSKNLGLSAKIFSLKKNEAEEEMLFEYHYYYKCYSKKYLLHELKKLNTSQLVALMVSGDKEMVHDYAMILIKSVKNKSDYLLAIEKLNNGDTDEELEILRNQAKFKI